MFNFSYLLTSSSSFFSLPFSPYSVDLPSTGLSVYLTTKGMVVAAKIDLANSLLSKSIPGFSKLQTPSFLPSASNTILTVTIAL
jgi:hypothetical protein